MICILYDTFVVACRVVYYIQIILSYYLYLLDTNYLNIYFQLFLQFCLLIMSKRVYLSRNLKIQRIGKEKLLPRINIYFNRGAIENNSCLRLEYDCEIYDC